MHSGRLFVQEAEIDGRMRGRKGASEPAGRIFRTISFRCRRHERHWRRFGRSACMFLTKRQHSSHRKSAEQNHPEPAYNPQALGRRRICFGAHYTLSHMLDHTQQITVPVT